MPNYRKRIEKWINALDSGKYQQAQGDLCSVEKNYAAEHPNYFDEGDYPTGYCCLGVADEAFKINNNKKVKGGFEEYEEEYANNCYPEIGQYLGISRKIEDKLIDMNDKKGQSFSQIARWIEKNVLPKAKTK